MKYISFCSGIEAATAAWHPLGWKPLAFCEIDKFPSRVLAHHYPSVPNLGDFTAVDWSAWTGKADICVGGTPCQAFSVAGLRKSLRDERGNLSLEFIRAVNIIRPQYVVWENVPGVLSTSDNAFGCFLAGLVGCEEPIVFEHGWPDAGVVDGPLRTACWRVLDAQYFGLAQRRRRVFVVASAGDGTHPAEILFEWESLRRDSPPRREAGEGVAGVLEARSKGGGGGPGAGTDGARAGYLQPVAMCLNAGGMNRIDAESETLIASTLKSNDSGNDAALELCPTLRAMPGGGGNHPAVAIQAGALRENPDSGPDGVGVQEHIAYTLEARAEVQAVCANTLNGNSGRMQVESTFVPQQMAVRRLTPTECERLQGFPDGYTAIPGAADGPRYRALGNSMAVPVMQWIGRRIQAATK